MILCVNFLKNWFMSLDNAEKITLIGILFPVFLGIVAKIISFFKWIFLKDCRDSRKILKRQIKIQVNSIKDESIFFNEIKYRPRTFFKHVPISFYDRENIKSNKNITVRQLKESFIIIGEAGCGKSAVLKQHFITKEKRIYPFKSVCYMFWDSNKIIEYINNENLKNDLFNLLKQSKYKNLYLYLDGIDEIGDENVQALFNFIQIIHTEIITVKLRTSCRTEFAIKHILNKKEIVLGINKVYKIQNWNTEQLQQFSCQILNKMRKKIKNDKYNDVLQYIKNSNNWEENINSPLLIKLLLYIKLFSVEMPINMKNKYLFYTQFLKVLVSCYESRNNNYVLSEYIESVLNEAAESVFYAYLYNKKSITTIDKLEPILKPIYNQDKDKKSIFCHETFFEYFVARYYYSQISQSNIDEGAIKAISQNYSNDFADFISDALVGERSEEERLDLAKRFISIYLLTITTELKEQYLPSEYEKHISKNARITLSDLSPQQFFSLKYEIIFRLGRLKIFSEIILNFLEFIYYNDENTKQVEKSSYYKAVLRRCCAISSSFLGGEKIEIDYVYHMLPFLKDNYDKDYDIANRSHTLLFYGDVTQGNIFSFQDKQENGVYAKWDHAREKRISRLSISLPSNIDDMDQKQKKKYYFRLFDLATIYTFVCSRSSKELTSKEINIIENCKINFENQSAQRTDLMRNIKEHILLLIEK